MNMPWPKTSLDLRISANRAQRVEEPGRNACSIHKLPSMGALEMGHGALRALNDVNRFCTLCVQCEVG